MHTIRLGGAESGYVGLPGGSPVGIPTKTQRLTQPLLRSVILIDRMNFDITYGTRPSVVTFQFNESNTTYKILLK